MIGGESYKFLVGNGTLLRYHFVVVDALVGFPTTIVASVFFLQQARFLVREDTTFFTSGPTTGSLRRAFQVDFSSSGDYGSSSGFVRCNVGDHHLYDNS